jgi:hypothetical protein
MMMQMTNTQTHSFRVLYEVRSSTIAGRGIFATESIKCGTQVWDYVVGESVLEHRSEALLRQRLATMSHDAAKYLLKHMYVWGNGAFR